MALAFCADCGNQVSTAAPACIHCGRPLSAAPSRPTAGIVTACVLGGLTLLSTLTWDDPATTDWGRRIQWITTGVHLLGCCALIYGAVLSRAGRPAGNAVVRTTSWGMILAIAGIMVMTWQQLSAEIAKNGDAMPRWLTMLLVAGGVFLSAQWALYLFLFRKSKYP